MVNEKNAAHKPETCGRETAYTGKEVAQAIIGASFTQFVQTATRDSGEASHA